MDRVNFTYVNYHYRLISSSPIGFNGGTRGRFLQRVRKKDTEINAKTKPRKMNKK